MFQLEKSDKPILTRWYLFRSVRLGIKVHKLKGDTEFHNHPWWGISLHLQPYREEFEDQPGVIHWRWLVNIVSPFRRHKVHVNKPVYTFFINFWRVNDKWTYGKQTKPWRGADTDPKPVPDYPSDVAEEVTPEQIKEAIRVHCRTTVSQLESLGYAKKNNTTKRKRQKRKTKNVVLFKKET